VERCKWLEVKEFTGTAQCLEKQDLWVTRQRLENTVVVKLDTFSTSVMDRAPQILLPSPPSPTAGPNQLVGWGAISQDNKPIHILFPFSYSYFIFPLFLLLWAWTHSINWPMLGPQLYISGRTLFISLQWEREGTWPGSHMIFPYIFYPSFCFTYKRTYLMGLTSAVYTT